MPMYRAPNMVSQAGIFKTGSPNYFDVSLGDAAVGTNDEVFRTFSAAATADAWATNDLVGVLAVKANGDYKVWTASWDNTNGFLLLSEEELTTGSAWTNNDTVTVSAVCTTTIYAHLCSTPTRLEPSTVTGTTYTLTAADAGKTLIFTNAAGCAVTADDALPTYFQAQLIQAAVGAVSVDVEGTDTLNGAATGTGVDVAGQWKSLFIAQYAAGAWLAV